jgi:hypothetical protein
MKQYFSQDRRYQYYATDAAPYIYRKPLDGSAGWELWAHKNNVRVELRKVVDIVTGIVERMAAYFKPIVKAIVKAWGTYWEHKRRHWRVLVSSTRKEAREGNVDAIRAAAYLNRHAGRRNAGIRAWRRLFRGSGSEELQPL